MSVTFNEYIFENKISEFHKTPDGCNDECDDIWDTIRELEDRNRRINLRIVGMKENIKETPGEVEQGVKYLYKNKLKITENFEIEQAHRTGMKKNGRPRTRVMKVLR